MPVLEPDEVHIWHARTDELATCDTALRPYLSPEELARADRFRFRRDASRFLRRRWLLRRILAAYGADPATVTLPTGPNGKPSVIGAASLQFNASSSGGLAVVALARQHQVGVDVERLCAVADRDLLVRSTMTAAEQGALSSSPGEQQDVAFLRLWTVKEAFMKALGTGLSLDPLRVESCSAGQERWTVSSADAGPPCTAVAVDVGPTHVASLAVPAGAATRLRVLAVTPRRLS